MRDHERRGVGPVLLGTILFSCVALVGAAKASDRLITSVCQLQGEVGPVAADHPAAAFVGLPVTVHAIWVSLMTADPTAQVPCHGGEISLNVGGTLHVTPITPDICSFDAPLGATGQLEIDIPDSPFSPTLFAYATPVDPRPAMLTGLDELVVAGNCYLISDEEAK
jgi:hypothetical protein